MTIPSDSSLAALEQSMLHAAAVVRCLAAIIYETGDSLGNPSVTWPSRHFT